jgi:pilus assembly protein CpaB
MKRSGRVYIVAGVVLALVAGALLFLFLNQVTQQSTVQPTPTPLPPVDVVVISRDLTAGTILTGEMLKRESRKVSDPSVTPETIRDLSEAVDHVIMTDMKSGTALKRGDVQTLPFVLPKGKKGMALFVDDLSVVGGLVRERDYVDVIVSQKIRLEKKASPTPQPAAKPQANPEDDAPVNTVEMTGEQLSVKAALQRVQVMKVIAPTPAQTAQQQQQQQQQQQAQQAQQAQAASGTPVATVVPTPQGKITNLKAIIILAVNDQEAELIRYANEAGGAQLILRGRDDADNEETKGMTLDILIRDYGLPVPRPVVIENQPEQP